MQAPSVVEIGDSVRCILEANTGWVLRRPKHPHRCIGQPLNSVRGEQVQRGVQAEVMNTGEETAHAYPRINQTVTIKCGNRGEHTRQEIRITACQNDRATKRGLKRAQIKKFPRVTTLNEIPIRLQTTAGCTRRMTKISITSAISSTRWNLEVLSESRHIVSDGNFKYAPKGIYQIYRIFAFVNGEAAPVVVALMKNKTQALYELFWENVAEKLSERFANHFIEMAHFDCEIAAVQALEIHFPTVRSSMCAFHVKQNLNRKVQQEGLAAMHRDNDLVQSIVRRLGAMCMVLLADVDRCYGQVRDLVPDNDEEEEWPERTSHRVLAVCEYYWTQWVNNAMGREFWNLFDLEDSPWTTNHAEAYHSHQLQAFCKHHLQFGEFLTTLQEIHHAAEERIEDLRQQRVPPRARNPVYVRNDARINDFKDSLKLFLEDGYTAEECRLKMDAYLDRMGRLLGVGPANNEECN